jgi:DNA-directed RNA polymerase specialized sigma subunit
MKRKRVVSEHYVNNKEFLEALIVFKAKCAAAKEAGEQRPQISNYIGDCFMKIATHLSYKPNFVNYMFREDMISDGIENCVQYIENFNPEKSKNPFAYFTQIIYYAFLRRIQKEKRQLEIKNKILDKSGYEVAFHTDDKGASSDYNTIKENVQIKIK